MSPQSVSPSSPNGKAEKEDRRKRNREAQKLFRKRRGKADKARLERLKRLGDVVERMSTVMVNFADRLLQQGTLQQYPALMASLQGVMAEVLALANEAGNPEEEPGIPGEESDSSTNRDRPSERKATLSGPLPDRTTTWDTPLPASGQQDAIFYPMVPTYTFAVPGLPVDHSQYTQIYMD
ncbi:hypothetical protein NW762_013985 [Fusarium torreyae]|uniref:BZIP domain-containing protein n=1 Tax=Fusarium torreyae TaxID=1237075 RepID=A0A9W8RNI9_9HYPO|nr:hypothetical protein NW762_013985 [Fusarium torreyae]